MGDIGGGFDDYFKGNWFGLIFGVFNCGYQCINGIDIFGIVNFGDYDLIQVIVILFK